MSRSSGCCNECGAAASAGATCWDQFVSVLAWEWTDPELQALHFLTVASYNLQHPSRFTDEALAGLRSAFRDHLERGVSVAALRRGASAFDGNRRVVRRESERRPVLREWPMTIAHVYASGRAEGAAGRVRAWAETIRNELEGADTAAAGS
ncbi:DUF5946 family protein [Gaopeijia maritima]|uniref:DUF5946 family protein n=1 Tax=Gaopeijia maritima TaxID=3119007 RepID=A0ABU9EC62_9BACT